MNKGIIVLVIGVVFILALPLLLSAIMGSSEGGLAGVPDELALPTKTVEAEYERIRAAGLPVRAAELYSWYKTPADNAAPVYTTAFDKYAEPSDRVAKLLPYGGTANLPFRGQPLSQGMRDAMTAHLKKNAALLPLLHRGASKSGCHYNLDFSRGMDTDISHLGEVRAATRLLCYEAALCADREDADGAARSLTSAFAMARSLRTEPCLVSQLVRYACLSTGIDTLDWVVNRVQVTDSHLDALSAALRSADEHRGLWHGLVGERAMMAHAWDDRLGPGVEGMLSFFEEQMPEGLTAEDFRTYVRSPQFDDDLMRALTMLDGLIRASDLPAEEGRPIGEAVERLDRETPETYMVCAISVSALPRVHTIRERSTAQCRAAIAGLAVARYVGANGAPPDSLDQLVPEYLPVVPLDPCDSQPLRHKKYADRFVVYSIGNNLTDDGGRESDTLRKAWESGDVTFVVRLL